jgi:general secretion pathway protein G
MRNVRADFKADDAGFTLLELLVVIAVLGLLAALVGPQVVRYLGSSRSQTAAVQIRNIASALELYRLDNGDLPASEEGLNALVIDPGTASGWAGPYLPEPTALNDPWGKPYRYRNPGTHREVDIYTLGADRREGGSGEDRDVGNWQVVSESRRKRDEDDVPAEPSRDADDAL